jgi:hypothetical protein
VYGVSRQEDFSVEATWMTVIIVITIVAGAVVAIVVPLCAVQSARTRKAEADARLRQDMLARGLSVADIERLSTTDSVADDAQQLVNGLISILALNKASGEALETALAAFQAADLRTKRLLYQAILGLCQGQETNASDEQILGVVRGLCRRERQEGGNWQNAEPRLPETPSPVPEIDGKWGDDRIRAEPSATADRPRD